MNWLAKKSGQSPVLVRVLPFAIFLGLTFCQGKFGDASRYWFYLAKTVIGAWMIWTVRPSIAELKWALSWQALAVGVGVFGLWVGLDGYTPTLDQLIQQYVGPVLQVIGLESWCPKPTADQLDWNPHRKFGQDSGLAWWFIAVRVLGSAVVVPPLEEVFYRSFVYRYLI